MKRLGIVFLLLLFVLVVNAYAGTSMVAEPVGVTTVADANVSGVDTDVSLTGHIVKVINEDRFVFTDGTGELLVYLGGLNVDENALMNKEININGMISQNFMYTEVKAASIKTLQ